MTVSSGIADSAKTGTAKSTTRKKSVWSIAPWLAIFMATVGTIYFSLDGVGRVNGTSTLPDKSSWGVLTDIQAADFNVAGVPNYWLDFSQPQGREKLYRGDVQVQACESHLAAVWGDENGQGGVNDSGPVHRGGTITTLDGTPVALPTDAVVCTAGPRGTTLVLATGPAYAAYHEHQLGETRTGVSCGSTPTDWGKGWKCVMSGSLDNMTIIQVPERHASGIRQCFQWRLRSNVLVFGDVKTTSVTNPWESYQNHKAYPRVAFGHYDEDGPQAAYYRFYPMDASGQCIPPT